MMCNCAQKDVFEKSLFYSSPAHGGWGVLKIAQLVPESYQLFVSPAACGRHGALAACLDGRKSRVSYLYLKEENIVSGDYEQILIDAVHDILEYLGKRNRTPKVLSIFVSCIDDLLGTDHEALIDELSELYPDMRFVFCHMNPTSTDTGVPPLVNVQNKNYSLLDRTNERDNGVNIIGTLEKIKENSEFFTILHQMGVSDIRHISYYHTFEEYNAMAKSRLNLVVAPSARYSAINMEKKHHMPHVEVFTSFSLKQIKDNYERIAVALDTDCPDITEYEEQCREELAKTAQTLRNMPVIIDGEAILKPYELARTLLENNINVVRIYEQQLLDCDKENFAWIMENHPEVEFRQPQNPKASFREQYPGEPLAIGYSAAYLTYAPHVVDITTQHGLYGYQGLCDLLQMMCKAAVDETDLKELLDTKVLVV